MVALGDITAPLTPETFLTNYWSRQAVHLRSPGRTFDRYFDWAAFDALLNSGALSTKTTVMSWEERVVAPQDITKGSDGHAVDPVAAMRLFRDGASISIRSADLLWPPLRQIVAGLYETFFETVHTNIYCSPADTQGFRCHYDLHEVFVLQIEGAKHWRVFQPTIDAPVETWRPEDVPDETTAPYIDVTLQKGDVLYVPRGHWHYATARDSHSLHITVGITCRKGDIFLDWLRPEVLAHPAWRSNVPVMGTPTSDGTVPTDTGFRAWARTLRAVLLDTLAEPEILDRFAADVFANTSPTPIVRIAVDGSAAPLPLETLVFSRPTGQRHVVSTGEAGTTVKVAGTDVALDVKPELLTAVLGMSPFTLADLERRHLAATREEIADLLDTLTRAGFLQASPRTGTT